MAPREATGAFPDQYLTFDYDVSAPMAVMPHDPQPPVGAAAPEEQSLGGADGGDAAGPTPQLLGLQQGLQQGLQEDGSSSATTADPTSTSYGLSGSAVVRAASLMTTAASAAQVVDPLSIDPTTNSSNNSMIVPTPWSLESSNSIENNQRSRSRYHLHEAIMSSSSLSDSGPGSQTAVTSVNDTSTSLPYGPTGGVPPLSPTEAGSRGSLFPTTDGSSSSSSNATSPISTGSSALNVASSAGGGGTPPDDYLLPSLPSPSSMLFASSPGSPVFPGTAIASSATIISPPTTNASQRTLIGRRTHLHQGHHSLGSVLDSISAESDDDDDDVVMPMSGLDTIQDSSSSTQILLDEKDNNCGSNNEQQQQEEEESKDCGVIVTDVDSLSSSSSGELQFSSPSSGDSTTSGSERSIRRHSAFDLSSHQSHSQHSSSSLNHHHHHPPSSSPTANTSPLLLSFGPNTTVSDLKYFAERGCIVALLAALTTPQLKSLGTRMLADYAKMPHRRVAVASNRRILEFVQRTMLECGSSDGASASSSSISEQEQQEYASVEWLAREYAVETVRSLTATEESDRYLMSSRGLLKTLALVSRGGPFLTLEGKETEESRPTTLPSALASDKARLHACIAIMNLSCGKANKIEIAKVSEVLEAMRDVMLGHGLGAQQDCFGGGASISGGGGAPTSTTEEEARLKATTCIKNLSNADANDSALLGTPGLVEALGFVASTTCCSSSGQYGGGATTCTTNACLALMNLSISKSNKQRVFQTPGVMDALMTVLQKTTTTTTAPNEEDSPNNSKQNNPTNMEARVKACSALSNLAIGYDNKIPMFAYPGFVDSILSVIEADSGEARTKACSILWSFAAEMKNQIPVVQRGDILPTLVRVAEEDGITEARFKCVAALTLLAESLENAIPLLESGALVPLMEILHEAGSDPTQWKGQTASWCVGFLMNMAQSDEAVPALREAGVVELLAPLLTLDHYQSLKAAMAVTFVCRYDEGDETYDLLRKTENVIPKIISLLHNTLSGRGGNGYKYGVFTLRSSVGCIASLASGPDFMKERIATGPVFESLLRVVYDFCVDGGTPGAIVGGGRDDTLSATLAMRALQSLTAHLIPIPGSSSLPFGPLMDSRLTKALESFEKRCDEQQLEEKISLETKRLATDTKIRIQGALKNNSSNNVHADHPFTPRGCAATAVFADSGDKIMGDVSSVAAAFTSSCCGFDTLPGLGEEFLNSLSLPLEEGEKMMVAPDPPMVYENADAKKVAQQHQQEGMLEEEEGDNEVVEQQQHNNDIDATTTAMMGGRSRSSVIKNKAAAAAVRTFLLTDKQTGRRFAVPTDPCGGRAFNDVRAWCYRRGRFCLSGEEPDPNFRWTQELQEAYEAALSTAHHGHHHHDCQQQQQPLSTSMKGEDDGKK